LRLQHGLQQRLRPSTLLPSAAPPQSLLPALVWLRRSDVRRPDADLRCGPELRLRQWLQQRLRPPAVLQAALPETALLPQPLPSQLRLQRGPLLRLRHGCSFVRLRRGCPFLWLRRIV
jgi:hypothetical protein